MNESDPTPAFEHLLVHRDGPVLVVTIDRPEVRNAIDGPTARELYEVFTAFDADDELAVAVLTGVEDTFCAGADLKAVAEGRGNPVHEADGDQIVGSLGPVGPSRLLLDKPVIAAVEGYAVAGGIELALWCDLRVASRTAVFGVFCRRWGVPLVDGGTIRLPRLIGHSRALDLILTGRPVEGPEALDIGLANRLCEPGEALATAVALAHELASLPQRCLRSDRRSSYEQWGMDLGPALSNETAIGMVTIRSGETREGASRFAAGEGRHGAAAPVRPVAEAGSSVGHTAMTEEAP
ncbi:MAG: crotonase/enoyl-CoA hydratase family protein [Actinomycetota bacterium]